MQPIHLQADPVLSLTMQLGEGPFWDFYRQQLFFLDINARQLHYYRPKSEQHGFYQLKRMPTALAMQQDHSLLVALEDRLARFVPETGQVTTLWELDVDARQVRTNDARVGPDGAYYLGTMDRKQKRPVAALYRVVYGGQSSCLLHDQIIVNGPTWSIDGQTMYYTDTPTRRVQAYDFESTTGTISSPRTLVEVAEGNGAPDGMTIDVEGHLWVAHHGAGCVARYHGTTGEMLAKVSVAAPNVSSCTFGGEDYSTLYITTAREGLSDEQLKQSPMSGSLFAVSPPWHGQATYSFGY